MTEPQSVSPAAKRAGSNLLWYAVACIIIAVGYMAYDTNGFRKPLSWFSIGIRSAGPVAYIQPPTND